MRLSDIPFAASHEDNKDAISLICGSAIKLDWKGAKVTGEDSKEVNA